MGYVCFDKMAHGKPADCEIFDILYHDHSARAVKDGQDVRGAGLLDNNANNIN